MERDEGREVHGEFLLNFRRKITLIDYKHPGNDGVKETKKPIDLQGEVELEGLLDPALALKKFQPGFTIQQTEMMWAFAESLGWTMDNIEREPELGRVFGAMGISKNDFRIWMTSYKKFYGSGSTSGPNGPSTY